MIEQVIGWVLVLQHYFLSFYHNILVYVKQLLSILSKYGGVSKKFDVCHYSNDINKKQTYGKDKMKLKPSSQIPGPKCLPVLGTLLEYNKFGSRKVHELSVERHKKYGDMFREKLLSTEMVFVANTDLLKQWMTQEGKLPISLKQEPAQVFFEVFPHLKRGLFFRDGEEWLRLRKLGHACLIKSTSDFEKEGLFDACEGFLDETINGLLQLANNGNGKGRLENIELLCYEITVGTLMSIVYGPNLHKLPAYAGTDVTTVSKFVKEINEHNQDLLETSARLAKLMRTTTWTGYETKLEHNLSKCITFGRRLREEVQKSPESTSIRSHGLLYKMTSLNASPEDVDHMLTDLAVDTKEPVASTCMFLTLLLGRHPEIQESIFNEVSSICPPGQAITYIKSKKLEYTEAFVKEALRLYPIAPFSTRIVNNDTELGGYHIKPGTILLYSTYVSHRDPRYFADPLKVWPERWLRQTKNLYTGRTSTGKNDQICDPSAFTSFGMKGRSCLGQSVAMSVLRMYTAKLVQKLKITSLELPQPTMRTVLYPVNPGPLEFEMR